MSAGRDLRGLDASHIMYNEFEHRLPAEIGLRLLGTQLLKRRVPMVAYVMINERYQWERTAM